MRTVKPATKRTRVLIVDDHPMTRAGLVHVINHQEDLCVCSEVENAAKALDAVEACKPDLVLVDITLPDKSGLELIKDVKAVRPGLPILVISMHDESHVDALRSVPHRPRWIGRVRSFLRVPQDAVEHVFGTFIRLVERQPR